MKNAKKVLWISIFFLLCTLVFGLLVYLPSQVERSTFSAPETSFQSWEEILSRPQAITLQTYATGNLPSMRSNILNLEHPKTIDIEDKMLDLPVIASILHHKKFGHYLIDAGLDASYVNNPYGNFKGLAVKMAFEEGRQKPNTHMAAIVARQNIQLQGVWFTHLHPDHIAGVVDLPKDIPYVVGKDERYLNFRYFLHGDHLAGIEPLYEIDFSKGVDLPPFGLCVDLFGDGSFWAIESSGHSDGHVLYLVNGEAEQALVTGDACNDQYQFDTGIGPGAFSTDIQKAQKVLESIITFKERYPQVKLVYGHDL